MKKMIRFITTLLIIISIIGSIPVSAMIPDESDVKNENEWNNENDGFTYIEIHANAYTDDNNCIYFDIPCSEYTVKLGLHRLSWIGYKELGVTLIENPEGGWKYGNDKYSKLMSYCDTIFRSGSQTSNIYNGYLGNANSSRKESKSMLIQTFAYFIGHISMGYTQPYWSKDEVLQYLYKDISIVDYNFARLRKAITKKQKALKAKDIWNKRFKYTKTDKKILKSVPEVGEPYFENKMFMFGYSKVGGIKNRIKDYKKVFDNIIKIVNGCKTEKELNKVLNILETFDYQYKEFRNQIYDKFEEAWEVGINHPDKGTIDWCNIGYYGTW